MNRGRYAADAAASAFLVSVAEEIEGEIDPSHSINCSLCKLFRANKRRRTSLLSPESSMRCRISQWRKKNNALKVWLHLEQSNNLQDSEKGEIDYSHGGLRLNSAYQIWKGLCC